MSQQFHTFGKHAPILGEKVYVAPGAHIIGQVQIGDDSSVFPNVVIRADVNYVTIGTRTNIQDNSTIHVADDYPCIIGDRVVAGHNVVIHACKVGDDCTIGMGAIILDGAEIGSESIVGAGALVTKGKKYPPRSLILGNPAKLIRELTEEDIETTRSMANKYVRVKDAYLQLETYEF